MMESTEGGLVRIILEEGNERVRDCRYQDFTWHQVAGFGSFYMSELRATHCAITHFFFYSQHN